MSNVGSRRVSPATTEAIRTARRSAAGKLGAKMASKKPERLLFGSGGESRETVAPTPLPVETDKGNRTLDQLTPQCCRWPIGDPKKPSFRFCGKAKVAGRPYCQVHVARAFRSTGGDPNA